MNELTSPATGDITVVKIGGNIVDNPEALARFVKDFASLPGRKILIHGGGKDRKSVV